MNAHARQLFVDGLLNRPSRPGYVTLRDVIEVYDNDYADDREIAEEAVNTGRPAYWTSAKYHDQRTIALMSDVNQGAALDVALEGLFPAHRAYARQAALDSLIPLNRLAANELSEAYETFCATFRDAEELERRAGRRAS